MTSSSPQGHQLKLLMLTPVRLNQIGSALVYTYTGSEIPIASRCKQLKQLLWVPIQLSLPLVELDIDPTGSDASEGKLGTMLQWVRMLGSQIGY